MMKARAITTLTCLAVLFGIACSSELAVFADSQKIPPRPGTTIETRKLVVFVAPQMTPCSSGFLGWRPVKLSATSRWCTQMSQQKNGPFYPDVIVGFRFVPGYKYKLLVRSTKYPVMDSRPLFRLLSVLEKIPAN
jgi:hypothetical protein